MMAAAARRAADDAGGGPRAARAARLARGREHLLLAVRQRAAAARRAARRAPGARSSTRPSAATRRSGWSTRRRRGSPPAACASRCSPAPRRCARVLRARKAPRASSRWTAAATARPTIVGDARDGTSDARGRARPHAADADLSAVRERAARARRARRSPSIAHGSARCAPAVGGRGGRIRTPGSAQARTRRRDRHRHADEPHDRLPVPEAHERDHRRRPGGGGADDVGRRRRARSASRRRAGSTCGAAAEAHDHWFVSERVDYTSSPAIRAAGRAGARRRRHRRSTRIDHFDLYSCFPCAVQIGARRARHRGRRSAAAHGHRRPAVLRRARATTTRMHAIAEMMDRLRARPGNDRARHRARLVRHQARGRRVLRPQPTAARSCATTRRRDQAALDAAAASRAGRASRRVRRRSRPTPCCTIATARRCAASSSAVSTTAGASSPPRRTIARVLDGLDGARGASAARGRVAARRRRRVASSRAPEPVLRPARAPTSVRRRERGRQSARARAAGRRCTSQATIPPEHPSARLLGTERMGSGAIIDPTGLILTVNYVVLGASEVTRHAARPARVRRARSCGTTSRPGSALAAHRASSGLPALAAPAVDRARSSVTRSSSSRASARARRASRTAPSATSGRSTPTGSTSSTAPS